MIDANFPKFHEFAERLRDAEGRLLELLDRFSEVSVLVAGDLTLDEFLTGEVERISREAPVPIIRHESTRRVPGGGANAVYNLATLGAKVKVAGLVGDDEQGRALVEIFNNAGIDTSGIFIDGERPTVTKTRISAHARQSVTQQVIRVDRKSDAPPSVALQEKLGAYIEEEANNVEAIVCSDYGDGVLTPRAIEAALKHHRTIVDTQNHLTRYAGATLFTPNVPEAEKEIGYAIDSEKTLIEAGVDLLDRTKAKYVLITRGGDGMSLFDPSKTVETVPAFNRTDVFDVTGAGDTVVAALTLALCTGGSPWEAVVLGNLAASIVVRQFGTATTTIEEMKAALAGVLENLEMEFSTEKPRTYGN
ncbi:bifunctional heptose 7-phosphate kinase/heptose 1-phosphate adenyltransferase [Baaleninema simplex]|uniref:bifunctional heptose 7-phosphate kinase/heptose 1-phosphate adenyltransferase n=1 Tax=Baaleninema simplex TaxID=2862350 RepID=UPI00034BCDA9|nr:PfkB family carbohydrate kinase [Baaleninema simplex]